MMLSEICSVFHVDWEGLVSVIHLKLQLLNILLLSELLNLCHLILQQDPTYSFETCEAQSQAKSEVHKERRKNKSADASALRSTLPPLKFAMSLAQDKGTSSWLTALPIEEHGFTLHKGAYRDALALRYEL